MSRHPKAIATAAFATLLTLVLGVTLAQGNPPAASIDPASSITFNSAHVSGTVNPEDNETYYAFEYAIDPDSEGWSSTGFQGPIPANDGPTAVAANLSGLKPGSTYRLRLTANNFIDPEVISAEESFETDAVNLPEAKDLVITEVTETGATFKGTVNSGGSGPGEASEYRFECTPACSGLADFQPFTSDGTDQEAQGSPALEPNTEYSVRLVARNAAGSAAAQASLLPAGAPPVLNAQLAVDPEPTAITLRAEINPRNLPATYRFEYGTEDCSASPCVSVPASEAAVGSDNKDHVLSQKVKGLEPRTTYHFRVLATSSAGTVEGEDQSFTLPASPTGCPNATVRIGPSAQAPDCRAFEWVSEARGASGALSDAGPTPFLSLSNQGVFSSPAGDSVLYPASDPFTGEAGTQATFAAERGSLGWTSTGVFPRETTGAYDAFHPLQTVAASDDLRTRIFAGLAPLSPDDTNEVADIYLQKPDGSLIWLSRGGDSPSSYVGRSRDATHIVFQTKSNLVPSAVGAASKLYEWANGSLDLVGYLENGEAAPGGALLLEDLSHVARDTAISPGGALIPFLSPEPDQSTLAEPTQLYIRVGGTETLLASESRCTRPDCNGPLAVRFEWMSGDGKRVFFTTSQQLLNEDTDEARDLYAYDIPSRELERLSGGLGIEGQAAVLGTSNDGEVVYFSSPLGIALAMDGINRLLSDMGSFLQAQLSPLAGCVHSSPQVTASGHYLLLSTSGSFHPLSSSEEGQGIWRYSLDADHWTRIAPPSEGLDGYAGMFGLGPGDCQQGHNISSDGSYVFFHTKDKLSVNDLDDEADVYSWHEGGLSLLSSGRRNLPSFFVLASESGRDVYFTTLDRLSPRDRDDVSDLYDARIGGDPGGNLPHHSPPSCVDADCQKASAPLLGGSAPATETAARARDKATQKPRRRLRSRCAGRKQRRDTSRSRCGRHKRGHSGGGGGK